MTKNDLLAKLESIQLQMEQLERLLEEKIGKNMQEDIRLDKTYMQN